MRLGTKGPNLYSMQFGIEQGIENNLVRCALGCNAIMPPNLRASEAKNDLGKAEIEVSGVQSVDLDGD